MIKKFVDQENCIGIWRKNFKCPKKRDKVVRVENVLLELFKFYQKRVEMSYIHEGVSPPGHNLEKDGCSCKILWMNKLNTVFSMDNLDQADFCVLILHT